MTLAIPEPYASPHVEYHIDGPELVVNVVMRLAADVSQMPMTDEMRALWAKFDPVENDLPEPVYGLLLQVFEYSLPPELLSRAWNAAVAEVERRLTS